MLARRLNIDDLKVIGNIRGFGDTAGNHAGMLLQVLEILSERQADTLRHTTVDLPIHNQFVVDLADIGSDHHPLDSRLTRLQLNCDLSDEGAVHVNREGIALRGLKIAIAVHGSSPLPFILEWQLGCNHLIIGIEPTTGLLHCGNQFLAAVLDCVARHHLRTASASRTTVGRDRGIVHYQLDLFWSDAQRT